MAKKTTIKPQMPTVQASVPESEKAHLRQCARELGVSTSNLVRTVLNKYLDTHMSKQRSALKK